MSTAPATSCRCPKCGFVLEDAPPAREMPFFVTATGEIHYKGKSCRVPPALIDIFEIILDSYPKAVPVYVLAAEIYGEREITENNIRVQIAHLRRAIRKAEMQMSIVARCGGGDRGGYGLVLDQAQQL